MKVKIDLPAFALFNGKMGGVPFVDGVSARPVTDKEARKIGINVRIVDVETGEQVGVRKAADYGGIPAAPLTVADHKTEVVEQPVYVNPTVVAETPTQKYTKDELETIAGEDGIKGIRDIAKIYDVKGVQIAQLITGILAAQGK